MTKRLRRAESPVLLTTLAVTLAIASFLLARRYLPLIFESRSPSNTASGHPDLGSALGNSRTKDRDASATGNCPACETAYFSYWTPPGSSDVCAIYFANGLPLPDRRCTPGAINPSITVDTLRDPLWRTRCTRGCDTSESQKLIVYGWYQETSNDATQAARNCELDHLVPLELGGSDGLGNVWPMCGGADDPSGIKYFEIKDRVENYLARQVRTGEMTLSDAQRGIASNWTQYVYAASR